MTCYNQVMPSGSTSQTLPGSPAIDVKTLPPFILTLLATLMLSSFGDSGSNPHVSAESAPSKPRDGLELVFTYSSEKEEWLK